jgi:hypothetical protein
MARPMEHGCGSYFGSVKGKSNRSWGSRGLAPLGCFPPMGERGGHPRTFHASEKKPGWISTEPYFQLFAGRFFVSDFVFSTLVKIRESDCSICGSICSHQKKIALSSLIARRKQTCPCKIPRANQDPGLPLHSVKFTLHGREKLFPPFFSRKMFSYISMAPDIWLPMVN